MHLVCGGTCGLVQKTSHDQPTSTVEFVGWPLGSDPAFFVIWSRFRQLRSFLACRPAEEGRIYRLLDNASTGSLGHGPIHLPVTSALEIGLSWDSEQEGWIPAGLLHLHIVSGPVQHSRSAMFQAWHDKVATDLFERKRLRSEHCFDIYGSHQLLGASHLRERDKMLLRAVLSGGVWNGFLLSNANKMRTSNVGSVVLLITMGTSSGNTPLLRLCRCETVLSSLP